MKPTKDPELALPSTQTWWRCPGAVYFLGVGEPPAAVKIGMLAVPPRMTLRSAMSRRLSSIQSSNHELVRVLGLIYFEQGVWLWPCQDAENTERRLHLEFECLARFKLGTVGAEWFTASPALLAKVAEVSVSPQACGVAETVGQLVGAA